MNYFTEPYKKYDGIWRGTHHYEMMADRRAGFNFIIAVVAVLGACVLLTILIS